MMASPLVSPQRMPPEVWLRIFGFATDVTPLLNWDDPISSDLPRSLVKQREAKALKDSLRTKRNIALVCGTWHELALEFLYQTILITKAKALASLHESLQRHAFTTRGKNGLGWWAKCLDVLIEDDRCEASEYGLLADIIRHLPNLSSVTLSMPMLPLNDCWLRQLPTSIVLSLAETCGPSLQEFDCSESILRPCREDLMLLLAASPNLRVLRCPICSPTPANRASKKRLDIPVMSNLESITLMSVFLRDYLPRNKDANHLPALRQLTYDCIPPPFFDHAWKSFVKLTCANVTSVTLDFCLPGDSLQKELDLLAECCTALEKLVIYLRSWLELEPRLGLPPISFLGLHSKGTKAPIFHYQALVSGLMTLNGPKLKVVQLLHASAVDELRQSAPLLAATDLASLGTRDFALEDAQGRVLFPEGGLSDIATP